MSNIGKLNIKIPTGVSVKIEPNNIIIEGKLGKLNQAISGEVNFILKNKVSLVLFTKFAQLFIFFSTNKLFLFP